MGASVVRGHPSLDSPGFNLTSLLDFSLVANMLLPSNPPPPLLEFFHLPGNRGGEWGVKQVLNFSLGSWNKKSSGVVG